MRVLFLFFILPCTAFSQLDSVRRPDIFRFTDGVLYSFSQPARWDKKDWLTLGGVVVGTALLSFADEHVNDFWKRQDSPFLDGVERVGYHYGKPYSATIFTGGFYLAGVLFKNNWSRETGLRLGVVLLTTGAIQTFSKTAFGRARPGTEVGAYKFDPFTANIGYHSFPSGHTSVAFAISLTVAKFTKSIPIKVIFYSLAGATAVSRFYSGAHWLTDITFGGVLAWYAAETAYNRLETNKFKKARGNPRTSLNIAPSLRGFSATLKF